MSLSRISKGAHSRNMGSKLFGSPNGFSGLGIAATSALLHMFGILSLRMQELRKSQNQDMRANPRWSINSGKMESNPGDFPGFRRLRAASSSDLNWSEILWPWGVRVFHRLDSCLLTSLVDSRFPVLCAPFFTSCEAMAFTETTRGASRPASKFVDCSPRLSARIPEVDGDDSFLPSLLLLLPEPRW